MIIANLCLPSHNIYSPLASWQLFPCSLTNNFCFNKYFTNYQHPFTFQVREKKIIWKNLIIKSKSVAFFTGLHNDVFYKNMTNTNLPQHLFSVPGDKTCSQINIHKSSNTCLFYAFCVMTAQQCKILLQTVKNQEQSPVPSTCTVHCNPVTVTQCCKCTAELSGQVVSTSTITLGHNTTNLLLLNFEKKKRYHSF